MERRIEPEVPAPGPATPAVSTMRIRGVVKEDSAREFSPAGVRAHLNDPSAGAWFDLSGVSRSDFPALSDILGLPPVFFESRLMRPSHPGITSADAARLIFVQEPEQALRVRRGTRVPVVTSIGLIVVIRGRAIVTVSRAHDRFFAPIKAGLDGNDLTGVPLYARSFTVPSTGSTRLMPGFSRIWRPN